MTRKLTARDRSLRKKYGITEEEYNTQIVRQGGGCKICGSLPKTRSLHVDHDHKIQNWKILSKKLGNKRWAAYPDSIPGHLLDFCEYAETKPLARAKVKEKLRRMSVRGIICFPCNRGIRVFFDDPRKMIRAAEYLQKYYDWLDAVGPRQGFEDDGPDNDDN